MTNKPFGVEELNIVGSAGTALVESVADLHIRVGGGCTVGIGTSTLNIQDGTADANNDSVLNAGIVTAREYYGIFKGSIDSGVAIENANNVQITDDTSDSGLHYIHFGSETSGYDGVEVDSTGLAYSDGKLGIGTTDPVGRFSVFGNSNTNERFSVTETTGTTFYPDNISDVVLNEGAGIAEATQVKGVLNMGASYLQGSGLEAGSGSYTALKLYLFKDANIDNAYGLGMSDGMLEIQSSATIGFFAGSSGTTGIKAERVRITSQGVGIGTTNITKAADSNNDYVLNAGIVTAREYYGTFKGTIDPGASITLDKIVELDTSAEVVDSGSDGHFKVITDNVEKLRLDKDGKLLLRSGTTSSQSKTGGFENALQIEGTSESTASISITRNSDDEHPAYLNFGKSRGTSVGSDGAVKGDDTLGQIDFTGSDGSGNYNNFAGIHALCDEETGVAVSDGDAPGRLIFKTSPASSTNPLERLRITSGGNVGIGTSVPTDEVGIDNTAVLAVGIVTAYEYYGTFKGTIDPVTSTVSISTNIADVFSIASNIISADDPGGDKIIFWDHSEADLTHLTIGSGLEIDGTSLKADGTVGKTYTLEAVDSNPNTTLRLSDTVTDDDVLITAGTNVSFADTTASGFTINVASGAGITFSAIDVKQYTDVPSSRTERTCTGPIVVHVESDTATIGIGSTSNAYGNKFIQEDDPTTTDGGSWTVCDGDIWYDTSSLGSGGGVSGSNRQIQFNDGGVLAGAANLLFYKSTTTPQLILRPSDTSVSSNGGQIVVENGDNTNYSVIHSDGGIELYRSDSSASYGGPYIDFKYQGSKDMDARIQMEHTDAYSGVSNDEFSSLMFFTGGGNLDIGSDPGLVTKKFTIGRYGAIGLCTVTPTSNVGYGTTGNVLISQGPKNPAVWSHTPTSGEWWHPTRDSVPLLYGDGVMEIGRIIDFHFTANSAYDWDGRLTLTSGGSGSGTGSEPATGGAFLAYNSIANGSDRRIKDNFSVITSALDKVGILTGYTFNYNNLGIDPNNSPRRAGLIAQDVEEVLPEVIIADDDTGIKGIIDSGVTALLVEAIKELKAQNEDLKARIVNLESQSK